MEMSQIRYFIAVCETLNFTRAAERCFISQPALTKGIKKLEDSIGGELFYRSKTSVELSYLGRNLLPYFKKIIEDAAQTKNRAKRLLTETRNTLRVGFAHEVPVGSVVELLESLKSQHSEYSFNFVEGDRHFLKEKLTSHEMDIVFTSDVRLASESSLALEVSSQELVIVYGRSHPFAKRHSISMEDLNGENLCIMTSCDAARPFQQELASRRIQMETLYEGNSETWIRSFINQGYAVSIMPRAKAEAERLNFVALRDWDVRHVVEAHFSTASEMEVVLAEIKTLFEENVIAYTAELNANALSPITAAG